MVCTMGAYSSTPMSTRSTKTEGAHSQGQYNAGCGTHGQEWPVALSTFTALARSLVAG
jgi:hypothetical protein